MSRPAYSPISATYGVRMEQFLESDKDYVKYHDKLNKKLQKLRHRVQLTTKDSKHYSSKEKYSKVTSEDYDNKDKLYGTVMLLHIERDLALCEVYKLRARGRGKLKRAENKILTTRLKKSARAADRLVELSKNEPDWNIRAQYLAYAKLANIEYLLYGKKNIQGKLTDDIAHGLALTFATLNFLVEQGKVSQEIVDSIHARYEYTLTQYAGELLSPIDLHNYIANTVLDCKQTGNDELVNIIYEHGFKMDLKDIEMETSDDTIKHINWRAFNCIINDNHLAQLIEDAKSTPTGKISDYSKKTTKWESALAYQENYINNNHDDIEDEENEQILLTYIRYQIISNSLARENCLFNRLSVQWSHLHTVTNDKAMKFKELERIVKNIRKYLQDLMELPGVYSDDDLLNQLDLAKTYFTSYLNASCLGNLYQSKHKNMEALALYHNASKTLKESYVKSDLENSEPLLPYEILTREKVENFIKDIKEKSSHIVAIAEYEKQMSAVKKSKYDLYAFDKLNRAEGTTINDVRLDNLYPLTPQLIPVGAKPSLFDMAFNYINYDNGEKTTNSTREEPVEEQQQEQPSITEDTTIVDDSESSISSKRRGFLGLFGR